MKGLKEGLSMLCGPGMSTLELFSTLKGFDGLGLREKNQAKPFIFVLVFSFYQYC
ncbi:hypothetical protein MFUM_940091 [Methylacidiphilum fumariolicum SolV]|uniref:Uncharacterized protein n=2 Tax=Candidatus Methylacidiphilum fumarolicum TaxID=591154 RepID=I0K147_METFB|nr:conserved protein of unknown function [Candidatus Methylacidiphilum fumarolicum]CCG93216.1 hypothetical protein MFUM_940091 [Methylacidiphilum fumariolicum SolV]